MALDLVLAAMLLASVSGVPGLFLPRASAWGQTLAAGLVGAAAVLGLAGAWTGLTQEGRPGTGFPWPAAGGSTVGVDALSAFFLAPVFAMGGLGACYGLGYWPQRRHPGSGRKVGLFWGLLVAGMALLVISRHALAFLLGWELMALSAFFLVSAEDHRQECRRAGWLYLIATHVATLALFGMFALWRSATGSFALEPVAPQAMSLGVANGLFALAVIGFGLKAGVMPLHFWLPGAHTSAPSHVSAMLSGVVIKMGIYGLVRFLSVLPDPPAAWGGLLLSLGAISGLLGVVFAIGQHDLKRLLAYHSVENIGIILMGLGLAVLGRAEGRPEWVVLGLAGCLLHVWNHGLFKGLLFLCAGAVVRGAHTRQIDRLGGLARTMPWTASMFLVGAVAICGLPPLNGFVSELFVYLGLLATAAAGTAGAVAAVAAAVLAMVGALAVACFVKVFGAVFLGTARTASAAYAREAPATVLGALVALAAGCALIGLAPVVALPALDGAIACWRAGAPSATPSLGDLAPLAAVSGVAAGLVAAVAVLILILARPGSRSRRSGTWDCGYARPLATMQYTASSFAQMIVALFAWVLHPRVHRPVVDGLFPGPTAMHSHVDDAVLERWLVPAGLGAERWFGWFRRFQQGLTQHYLLYILIAGVLILGTLMPVDRILARWFAR